MKEGDFQPQPPASQHHHGYRHQQEKQQDRDAGICPVKQDKERRKQQDSQQSWYKVFTFVQCLRHQLLLLFQSRCNQFNDSFCPVKGQFFFTLCLLFRKLLQKLSVPIAVFDLLCQLLPLR